MSLKDQFGLRLVIGNDDATNLLDNGASFANSDPGGFESASFSVPRDVPQTLRGQYVRLDCGLGVAWEGRVKQIQRSLGSKTAIQCEGYSAALKDQSTSMVFVDRDLTRWTTPTFPRQAALVAANWQLGNAQVAADPSTSNPALVQQITAAWASPYTPAVESWYDAGPQNLIRDIYYDYVAGPGAQDSGVNWGDYVHLSSDAAASILETSPNLNGSTEQKGYYVPATQYRFAILSHLYNSTPAGTQGAQYNAYWHNLAVYGSHGMAGRGTDPVGFYPSDIAGWVATQLSSIQTGTVALTDSSGYIVPHSVYYTPVTLDQIIGDMATIAGWHWGVWESPSPLTGDPRPRFDFRPRPVQGAFTSFCRRQDCDTLDITEDLSQQYNEVVVTFSNVDGTDGVAIVTADNPILDQAGISNRTLVLSGGTMTQATAALFGAEALAITNSQARVSGSADIITAIDGGTRPAWMLRAGIDRLRIGDAPSVDAWGTLSDYPIRRVECSLSPEGWRTSVEVGTGADLVESLQARLTAATSLAAVGG